MDRADMGAPASKIYRRDKDFAAPENPPIGDHLFDRNPWFKTMMDDYREMDGSELPEGINPGENSRQPASMCRSISPG